MGEISLAWPVDDAGEDQGQTRARIHRVVDLASADAAPLPVIDSAGRVGAIDTLAVQAPNARAEAHADPRESEGGQRRRGRRPAGFCQEQTDVLT